MRAIQIDGPKHMVMVDVPKPEPVDGQVLVRNHHLSACGTDMHAYRRVAREEDYPFRPGAPCHECVGIIEESRVPGLAAGQRVIALPSRPHDGPAPYGGGAEYMVTEASRIIPLPSDADMPAYLMCQPVGTVVHALHRMGTLLGKRVVVLGQGAIGLSFTALTVQLGAREVITVDPLAYRLERAASLGATRTVDPFQEELGPLVAELTEGQGADIVVEATGTEQAANQAVALVRHGGSLLLFGLPLEDVIAFDYGALVRKEAVVVPNYSVASGDPAMGIGLAVSLMAQGRLDLSWLVSHRLPFAEAPRAYETYEAYLDNVLKVVIDV